MQVQSELRAEKTDFTTLDNVLGGMQARGNVKELLLDIRALCSRLRQQELVKNAIPVVQDWQAVLQELEEYISQQKAQLELLTFDDLELQALELLQSNEQVRRKYHERFRYIMVDEFQDTNERQRQLIYLL